MTQLVDCIESRTVFTPNPPRPYFDAWRRRAGRQLAVSGRLSQIAITLAAQDGIPHEEWKSKLRVLLDGHVLPSLDLLMRLDTLLAAPSHTRRDDPDQGLLF